MSFQTPLTVEEMLSAIHRRDYLMPAIQREFVWHPEQIVKLVDSLMRGYPVGSFLLWKVDPETARAYVFYEFLTNFHERDSPYASKATVSSGTGTTAVLDGQQRLTSLNIALYGSYAVRRKHARRDSPGAYPVEKLYLNLMDDAPGEELGTRYDLQFLTTDQAAPQPDGEDKWFRVGAVLDLANSGPAVIRELERRRIPPSGDAYERLYALYEAVRVLKPMNYYVVTDQDPDKVLEIFVRVNSGGTTLSYSDLLLSMATNQWKDLDAREEVRQLVADLNTVAGRQFNFTKDHVLKTALTIAGVDVRFKVTSFTQANMGRVEAAWPQIRGSLLRAAALLQQFGYNERNLTASSVITPVAHYLHVRRADDSYLDSSAAAADRLAVQGWVTRSLIKRGIWGSGLDTTLTRIRQVLTANAGGSFPVVDVEAAMASVGKSLTFDAAEIDELLTLKYGGKTTFSVLSVIYPGLDLGKNFHEDHIFPKSIFTPKKLAAAGVSPELIPAYLETVNFLPNLQLLAGTANIEKQDKIPLTWVSSDTVFPTPERRRTYLDENDLDGLPLTLDNYLAFYDARRKRIRERLTRALGRQVGASSEMTQPPLGNTIG